MCITDVDQERAWELHLTSLYLSDGLTILFPLIPRKVQHPKMLTFMGPSVNPGP